jgi:hypothetical protein
LKARRSNTAGFLLSKFKEIYSRGAITPLLRKDVSYDIIEKEKY